MKNKLGAADWSIWFPQVGEKLAGRLIDKIDLGYGDLPVIRNWHGEFAVPSWRSIEDRIPELEIGKLYLFDYLGEVTSKTGSRYNSLDVYEIDLGEMNKYKDIVPGTRTREDSTKSRVVQDSDSRSHNNDNTDDDLPF